jgi:hypothetical protein
MSEFCPYCDLPRPCEHDGCYCTATAQPCAICAWWPEEPPVWVTDEGADA